MENRPGATPPPIDESVDRVRSAAENALHDAKYAAKDAASAIKDKALGVVGEAQNRAADETRTAAHTLRDTASNLNGELPWMKTALDKTADGFDQLTNALNRGDIGQCLNAVTDFARRQPALFMGLSVAAGFALARVGKTAIEEVQEHAQEPQREAIRESVAPYAPPTEI
jgi:ElaB/YqjD/DUF883 family membrane-anchored ribosome-binding protein